MLTFVKAPLEAMENAEILWSWWFTFAISVIVKKCHFRHFKPEMSCISKRKWYPFQLLVIILTTFLRHHNSDALFYKYFNQLSTELLKRNMIYFSTEVKSEPPIFQTSFEYMSIFLMIQSSHKEDFLVWNIAKLI